MRVCHISTFPPTKCGIAFYTQELIENLSNIASLRFRLSAQHEQESDCDCGANVSQKAELERLAETTNSSGSDVVSLQHEFGIWGGHEGEHIQSFLQQCRIPLVTTLHTPEGRASKQVELLQLICNQSKKVVVLSESAQATIHAIAPQSVGKTEVIRHGVPDVPFVKPAQHNSRDPNIIKFISVGFFRPDKGLETVLESFSLLKKLNYRFSYRLAGVPQPQSPGQQEYLERVLTLVREMNLQEDVTFVEGFKSKAELAQLIQKADCGVIGYTGERHSSSGVIPFILACGRPVVSTPIDYSRTTASIVPGCRFRRKPPMIPA